MRRYGGDGEGFFTDDDSSDEYEKNPQEFDAVIDLGGQELLASMELDILEQGLNQELLSLSIQICRQNIFWYFRSHSTKVRKIVSTYRKLTKLVRETLEKEED
jgi:hypothetical protein